MQLRPEWLAGLLHCSGCGGFSFFCVCLKAPAAGGALHSRGSCGGLAQQRGCAGVAKSVEVDRLRYCQSTSWEDGLLKKTLAPYAFARSHAGTSNC